MKKKLVSIIIGMLLFATMISVTGNMQTTTTRGTNTSTLLDDIQRPSGTEPRPIPMTLDQTVIVPASRYLSHGGPEYEFIKTPFSIMTNYYDYMPGNYASHPIRLQTDNGDGQYLIFHSQSGTAAQRREYWAYIDKYGNLEDSGTITSYNNHQGYGGIGIHPATGDCIASWHEDKNGDTYLDRATTYDDFDASETPGFWQVPSFSYGAQDVAYVWPTIYVGPSPQGNDYVRIYQVSNNQVNTPAGLPCEDVNIMWTDVRNVNGENLQSLLNLATWNSTTVFTPWREKLCRPFQAFAIDYNHPGKVAFIGCAAWLQGDLGNMPVDEGAFVWESLDYGETWSAQNLHSDGPGNALYQVSNIGQLPAPDKLNVTIMGWHNTALYDSDGNLHWTYLQAYGFDDEEGSKYFPYFMPQAEMVWDGTKFSFHEVTQMPGIDPLSGHRVPWIDPNNLFPVIAWSTYPSGTAPVFHENTQKQAINLDNDWMIQMWVDGTYHQFAKDQVPGYEAYLNHPLIFIATSIDNGKTWSKPIELTDVNNEKFNFKDQITVYPYVCDQITDLGDNWGQIYMYYLDDYEYGSRVHGTGLDPRGNMTYCSLKIKFEPPAEEPKTEITDVKGGFGKITAGIKNSGNVSAPDVDYSITVFGGILKRINFTTTGTISEIAVGDTETIQTDKFIFGLGNINVTITATYSLKSWKGTGFVFGPFVLKVKQL